ncbi:MAG TPA: hypothetical protein VIO39_00755 [Methylotenera sp.]
MNTVHVLAVVERAYQPSVSTLVTLRRRLIELGYDEIVDLAGAALLSVITEHRLGAVTVEAVLDSLGGDNFECPEVMPGCEEKVHGEDFSGPSTIIDLEEVGLLVDGLSSAAAKGRAATHYALSLIYRGDNFDEEVGSPYWHSQMEQGGELVGAYKDGMLNSKREGLHLGEAARLGWLDARLDIAIECAQRAEI